MPVAPRPSDTTVVVYTDGACLGNPGPGGWGWAVPDGPWASGAVPHSTNQRMEITAVIEALRAVLPPGGDRAGVADRRDGSPAVEVRSDSTYVVNCFLQRWWAGWQRRGWRNSQNRPVANRDLWEALLPLALDPARPVRFVWVKGHSGDHWNDVVDSLATAAAASGGGRSGDIPPD